MSAETAGSWSIHDPIDWPDETDAVELLTRSIVEAVPHGVNRFATLSLSRQTDHGMPSRWFASLAWQPDAGMGYESHTVTRSGVTITEALTKLLEALK